MGVVYFSIIPTFEPSRYCKCWIVCFYDKISLRELSGVKIVDELGIEDSANVLDPTL